MNLERLDLEKYEALELERSNTIADKGFQQWMSELNVSQSYEDRGGIIRANELNAQNIYIQGADYQFTTRVLIKHEHAWGKHWYCDVVSILGCHFGGPRFESHPGLGLDVHLLFFFPFSHL